MNRTEISQLSFDCVLPSAIFFNDNLEPNCLKLYAMVRNLSKMAGYCFATNEYLSKLLNVDDRTIKRWIKSLSKEGYLEIHTEKNGIQWQRRIYLSDRFKKCLRRDNFVPPGGQNCHPPQDKIVPHKEEYSKEEYSKESPISPKGKTSSSRKKIQEEKIMLAPEVHMTKTQIDALKLRLNHDLEKETACYRKLSDWKISKQITGGNDYAHMTKWVVVRVEEDFSKPKPVDRVEANKAFADQVKAKFGHHKDITVGTNYVEFNLGNGNCPHFRFTDKGFQECVEGNLRKLGLKL